MHDHQIGFTSDYQTSVRNNKNLFLIKLSTNKNNQITVRKDQSLTSKNRNYINKDKVQGIQTSLFEKEIRPKTAVVGIK